MDSSYPSADVQSKDFINLSRQHNATQNLQLEANLPEKPLARHVPGTCSESDMRFDYCQPFRFATPGQMMIAAVDEPSVHVLITDDVFSQEGTRQRLTVKSGHTIELDNSGTLTINDKLGRRLSIDEIYYQSPQGNSTRRYFSVGSNNALMVELDTSSNSLTIDLPERSYVRIGPAGFNVVYRDTIDGYRSGPRRQYFHSPQNKR